MAEGGGGGGRDPLTESDGKLIELVTLGRELLLTTWSGGGDMEDGKLSGGTDDERCCSEIISQLVL